MFGDDEKDDVFPTPRKSKDSLPWLDEVSADLGEGVIADNKQRIILIAVSLTTILLFGSLVSYIYIQNNDGSNLAENETLLVHAPEGPSKIEPKDRGGLHVPDQDRVVFDAVTGEDSQNGENIQRGPEQPLDRPTENTVDAGVNNSPLTQEEPTQKNSQPLDKAPAPTQPPVEKQTQPATQPATQPETQSVSQAIANAPDMAGKFLVQMGAFGNQIAAQNAWDTISQRLAGPLSRLLPVYQGVERGGVISLFRLRAGPIDTRHDADSVCDFLKASNQACFVVSP